MANSNQAVHKRLSRTLRHGADKIEKGDLVGMCPGSGWPNRLRQAADELEELSKRDNAEESNPSCVDATVLLDRIEALTRENEHLWLMLQQHERRRLSQEEMKKFRDQFTKKRPTQEQIAKA